MSYLFTVAASRQTSWLSLSGHLGDCFLLDDEAYPPSSYGPTLTPVILRSYLISRVCLDLVPLLRPAPKPCFTPGCLFFFNYYGIGLVKK